MSVSHHTLLHTGGNLEGSTYNPPTVFPPLVNSSRKNPLKIRPINFAITIKPWLTQLINGHWSSPHASFRSRNSSEVWDLRGSLVVPLQGTLKGIIRQCLLNRSQNHCMRLRALKDQINPISWGVVLLGNP